MNKNHAAKKIGKSVEGGTRIDWMLVLIVIVLLVFGLIMLYSASSYNAQLTKGDSAWFVKRQLYAILAGLFVMMVIAFLPLKIWRYLAPFAFLVSIGAMFLVLSPLGLEIKGATRWLDLKVITIQPVEIVKFAMVLMMALFITKFIQHLDDWRIYLFSFAFCAVSCALAIFLTDDLGSTIILFAMGIAMLFLTCPKIWYVLATIGAAIVAVAGIILIKPNKAVRIKAWIHLDEYAGNIAYQIKQALYAIGSGGFFGKGLGKSTQKMGFVPETENDMIFSIICEELGIIGAVLFIGLIVFLIWRMKKIYDRTKDVFARILVAGVATHIALQTFVNIGVVSGLIPNTGITLPFVSNGGSAIMFLLAEIGLVLAVGRLREKKPVDNREEYYRRDREKDVIYFQ